MVNDMISDMLTRIRNASLARKKTVLVSKTKIHEEICEILQKERFILSFQNFENKHDEFIIHLKYEKSIFRGINYLGKPCITNLKRISKPGLRIYTNYKDIPKIFSGMGIIILSTPKGLMTDRDARACHLGGEIICSVW